MYLSMTLETLKNSEKQVLLNFVFIPYIKPFVFNAPLLYPLKTSENLTVPDIFKKIEKGSTENKWVKINLRLTNFLKIFLSFEDVM